VGSTVRLLSAVAATKGGATLEGRGTEKGCDREGIAATATDAVTDSVPGCMRA